MWLSQKEDWKIAFYNGINMIMLVFRGQGSKNDKKLSLDYFKYS